MYIYIYYIYDSADCSKMLTKGISNYLGYKYNSSKQQSRYINIFI